MAEDPVSIAIVGAGLVGRRHLAALARVPGARLAAVVDPDPAAEAMAAAAGAPWRRDLADCLARDRPEAVILATPNHLHADQGRACVAAGVAVLVEKPIAEASGPARALVEAAEAAGVPLMVGHHRRHNPLVAAIKARIEAGEIGAVRAVNALCWLMKPADYFAAAWRTGPGAGPVFINLIHDIDLMRHFAGEVIRVQAMESRAARGHAVEDAAAAVLGFASGALGTVSVSDAIVAPWSWELTAAENPAYPATGQTAYHIGGALGSIDVPAGALWRNPATPGWWEPMDRRAFPVARADPLERQIAQLAEVARGRAAPLVSGRDGLRTLLVIEALKAAAASGAATLVAAA